MSFENIYKQLDPTTAIEYVRDTILKNPEILPESEIDIIIKKEMLLRIMTLDEDNNSLLHLAVQQGYLNSVKYILTYTTINPFLKNKNGKTAFSLSQNPQITAYLISANLLIDEEGTFNGALLKNKIALGERIYIKKNTPLPLPLTLSTLKSFNKYFKTYPQENNVLNRLHQYLAANIKKEKNNCFLFVQHLCDRLENNSYGLFFNTPSYIKSNDSLSYTAFKRFLEDQIEMLEGLLGILLNIREAKDEPARNDSLNSSVLPGPPPNIDPVIGLILLPFICLFCAIGTLDNMNEIASKEDRAKRLQELEEKEIITIRQIDKALEACFLLSASTVDEKTVVQKSNLCLQAYANKLNQLSTTIPQDFVFFKTTNHTASQKQPTLLHADENTPLLF